MYVNPYPKLLEDEISGILVPDDRHKIWQEGYEVGWNEAKAIVQKVNAQAGDIRTFERIILAAFIPPKEQ